MGSPPPSNAPSSTLPLKKIPGGYGVPFFGAIGDRYDYFYRQGRDEFFRSRMKLYNSTIFRSNMPPGPFISSNPRVVVLLDAVSFPILFDNSKVEKRDLFVGTYMPSVSLTGGHRVCSYLDTTENKHQIIKKLFLSQLASRHKSVIPLLRTCLSGMFTSLDDKMSARKTSDERVKFDPLNEAMSFDFVTKLFSDQLDGSNGGGGDDDYFLKIREKGPSMIAKWLLFQLGPLMTLVSNKLLIPLEDLILHTFPLPPVLVKSDYKKVYDAFYASSTSFLDEAEKSGLDRSEACHNLVFMAGFNANGGIKAWFPALLKWVARGGSSLHSKLAEEIRTTLGGGDLTFAAMEKMSLTKSVVYEALRMDPPVPFQYGKCREDMVIETHDATFKVKKGEMLFGFQPFATRDPKVFERAEEFVPDRFVGVEGEKMLKYVFWSNGRETDEPTPEDKQCPGKDLVVLLSRVLLVEFFLRYDSFEVVDGTHLLSSWIDFVSLTKTGASAATM